MGNFGKNNTKNPAANAKNPHIRREEGRKGTLLSRLSLNGMISDLLLGEPLPLYNTLVLYEPGLRHIKCIVSDFSSLLVISCYALARLTFFCLFASFAK
jgi:hypothetical protein